MRSLFSRLPHYGVALSLFLVVVGAKWTLHDRFGSDIPNWDQWDAEAKHMLIPWFQHDDFIKNLFQPHNEHRIVLTKLQNLTVTLTNGQWDARLQTVLNAALHSILAVAFWCVARRWLGRGWELGALGLALVFFALPLSWENILAGFHSQQYWLLGLSFAAIVALPFATPWTRGWWAALLAAILSYFTMGSGFLAAIVVAGVVIWRAWHREIPWRAAWPTLVGTLAITAVGLATRVEVYYHQQLKAKTAHDFIFSALRSLEWPLLFQDWGGIVTWAPWLIVVIILIRRRLDPTLAESDRRALLTMGALGGWVFVQIIATAYARGANADYPPVRYMDTLVIGGMTNGIALLWLLARASTAWRRGLLVALLAGWCAAEAVGLRGLLDRNLNHELPDARTYYRGAELHLRGYLGTDDPAELAFRDVPYPSGEGLVERLGYRPIRNLMPVSVRTPLRLTEPATSSAFVRNQASVLEKEPSRHGLTPATVPYFPHPTWGSFGAQGTATTGEWRTAKPLQAQLGGWLKFETAGQLGEPGVALELRDAETDRVLAQVTPTRVPGDGWRAAYVRAPERPFLIVARDQDAARWFAFSAPVEMAEGSYLAWQATRNGLLLVQIAGALLVAFAFWHTLRSPAFRP